MRASLPILLSLSLAGASVAQTPQPEGYEILPGRASGNNNGISMVIRITTGGEVLQMYDMRHVQGLGDLRGSGRGLNQNSPCEVNTVKVRYQDQNGNTSEGFKVVARGESATTPRDADTATTLFSQNVPGWPSQTATTAISVLATVVIMDQTQTPAVNSAIPVPCDGSFFVGMDIPPVPSGATWPNDGLSITASLYDVWSPQAGTTYSVVDWPKGGINADPLYYCVTTAGAGFRWATTTVPPFCIGINLVPDAPVLQMGALHESSTSRHGADENFGAAGYWPEADATSNRGQQSHDGVVMRITDNQLASGGAGAYGLYLSINTAQSLGLPYFNIPGIAGGIYLGLPNYFVIAGALTGQDTLVNLATPTTLPPTILGTSIWFQAYSNIPTGNAGLTNLAGIEFKQ